MIDRAKAYAEAGVDLEKANSLVSRIKKLGASTHIHGVLSELGGFGGLFKLNLKDMSAPVLVASTDGVGTKLKLAVQYNKHDTIGIDLVAMSVNDIIVQGAVPLIFLDYVGVGSLDLDKLEQIVSGVAEGCRQSGCALLGGETAELPGIYSGDDYDLAGFCVGIVDNSRIVDGSSIAVGDAIIGLASSGLHSNGYSLARKILAENPLAPDDIFPGSEESVQEALLKPTKIYVDVVLKLLRDVRIKGMAHITGGGFYDNLPRVLPLGVKVRINAQAWDVPPVFNWLKKTADLDWSEMMQVFNCGIGFALIVSEDICDEVLDRLGGMGQAAWRIGEVERRESQDVEQVEIIFK